MDSFEEEEYEVGEVDSADGFEGVEDADGYDLFLEGPDEESEDVFGPNVWLLFFGDDVLIMVVHFLTEKAGSVLLFDLFEIVGGN